MTRLSTKRGVVGSSKSASLKRCMLPAMMSGASLTGTTSTRALAISLGRGISVGLPSSKPTTWMMRSSAPVSSPVGSWEVLR